MPFAGIIPFFLILQLINKLMMMKIGRGLIVLVLVVVFNKLFCQDTIWVSDKKEFYQGCKMGNPEPVIRLPSPYYHSKDIYCKDTIYYDIHLKYDTVSRKTYNKLGINDLWASYYKNGTIKEIGHFKKNGSGFFHYSKKNVGRIKIGEWIYFSDKGVITGRKIYQDNNWYEE